MQSFKFSELEYVRPDFTAVGQFADDAKEAIEKAASYEELKRLMQEMEEKNNHLATMATIAFIRHTLDTRDAFYEKEDEYINHIEKHGHWKDTAIRIKGAGVNSLTLMFLQMWHINEDIKDLDKYFV